MFFENFFLSMSLNALNACHWKYLVKQQSGIDLDFLKWPKKTTTEQDKTNNLGYFRSKIFQGGVLSLCSVLVLFS